MTLETWLAFLVAAVLISVSPGAGAIACMTTGMRYGYRLGVWNIFGMQVGIALQLAIVGAGLGAVLAASTLAFTVLKWLGVAYLAWLGWRADGAGGAGELRPRGDAAHDRRRAVRAGLPRQRH